MGDQRVICGHPKHPQRMWLASIRGDANQPAGAWVRLGEEDPTQEVGYDSLLHRVLWGSALTAV